MEIYRHKIQYYETDAQGIVHHSNYIRFMEEARIDFMEKCGFGYDKMEQAGVWSPVIAVSCDYKSPTRYPQTVDVEVKIAEMSALKVKIAYTITSGGRLVCKATSTHAFMDAKTNRPAILQDRFPELYAVFKDSMES